MHLGDAHLVYRLLRLVGGGQDGEGENCQALAVDCARVVARDGHGRPERQHPTRGLHDGGTPPHAAPGWEEFTHRAGDRIGRA